MENNHIYLEQFQLKDDFVNQVFTRLERKSKIQDWHSLPIDEKKNLGLNDYLYNEAILKELDQIKSQKLDDIFLDIALNSANPADFINRARIIKSVDPELANYFSESFGTDSDGQFLSMEQAAKNYLEYAIGKNLKQASKPALKYYMEDLGCPLPF